MFGKISEEGNILSDFYYDNSRYYIYVEGEIYDRLINREEYVRSLFLEYGHDFVNKIEGEFVIVVYDSEKKELSLFRDYAGSMSLFYAVIKTGISFASDYSKLVATQTKKLNMEALNYFFSTLLIPGSLTCFEDVFLVEMGHYIKYSLITKKVESIDWKPLISKNKITIEEAVLEIEKRLVSVINKQSSSKVGLYLSGGVDSSLIALLIKNRPFETITTINRKNPRSGESAKFIADIVKSNHHETIMDVNLKVFEKCISSKFQLSADPAMMLNYYLAETAKKENVGTILEGVGADILFSNIYKDRAFKSKIREKKKKYFIYGQDVVIPKVRQEESTLYFAEAYVSRKSDFMRTVLGLNIRFPFLSKAVIEFAFSLPDELLKNKQTLRILLSKYVSYEAFMNKSKADPDLPIDDIVKEIAFFFNNDEQIIWDLGMFDYNQHVNLFKRATSFDIDTQEIWYLIALYTFSIYYKKITIKE